jgi:hypothetical protein
LPTSPKNIAHVLWKAGIYDMNPEAAMGAMVGDGDSAALVVGRPRVELQKRFGYLLELNNTSPLPANLLGLF